MLGATITGNIVIGLNSSIAGTVTNAGTIVNSSSGQAISLWGGGTVTNLATGVIQAHDQANAVAVIGGTSRIVDNYGLIQSNDTGFGTGVSLQSGTLTNYTGAQILGAYNAIWSFTSASTITNHGDLEASKAEGGGSAIEVDAGGTIVNTGTIRSFTSNATTTDAGISFTGAGSITNSGTIESTDGGRAIVFNGAAVHTLNLDTGSVLGGNVQGGSGTDNLVLMGSGSEDIGKFLSFETLSMQGSAWTLSGTGNFSTSTTVQSGLLSVNGTLTSPIVTIGAAGTLGGTGTVIGDVTVNGTVAPGNSIGTLNVTGNLTFNSGSVYRVEVSPSAADRTNVTGTANLAGTVNAVFTGGTYASNSYTILSAAARNGTFDALTTTGLPAYLSASLSYSPTDVLLLTLASNIQGQPTVSTPTQQAVAGALDNTFNGGQGQFPGFGELAPGQFPGALEALSGELYPTVQTTLIEDSLFMRDAILSRLRQASYQGGGSATAALSTGGPALAYGPEAQQAYAAAFPLKAAPANRASDYTYWATVLGTWGHSDSNGNAASARRDLGGVVSGIDKKFGAWRLGMAGGYTTSDVHVDDRQSSAKIESYRIAGYAATSLGPLNARGGVAFAWHEIDANRTVDFPGFYDQLSADYHGTTAQVFGELGYGFDWAGLALEPFVGVAWVDLHTHGFNELGGAAALNGASESQDETYSTLGLRLARTIMLPRDMTLTPRATVAWQHAFDSGASTTALAFANTGAGFTVAGLPIAQDSALIEAGVDWALNSHASLGIAYTGKLAADATDNGVSGRFSWVF